MEESIVVDFTISAQESRAFSLMSSRKKIRQAPGGLLRQKLVTLVTKIQKPHRGLLYRKERIAYIRMSSDIIPGAK